jgi:hypothetical protein
MRQQWRRSGKKKDSKTGMIGLGMLPIFSKRIGGRGIGLGEKGFFCSLSQRR